VSARLCIVRHGETAWNAAHRVQGQLDVPLNAAGLAQAEAVARALSGEGFDAVYSSDLARCLQTARPLARLLGLAIIEDRDLRERHYGVFQEPTYAEVKARFPEAYARFEAREPDFGFRTGETLREFSARSLKVISTMAEKNRDRHIAVFTHGGVLDEIYRFIRGVPAGARRDFGIPNCGINRIEVGAGAWRMQSWADIAHLEGALDDL